MKRALMTSVIVVGMSLLSYQPARALFGIGDIVFDPSNFAEAVKQVEQAIQMVEQAKQTVQALTNIPANLISQASGLLNLSVQNPLQQILGNLRVLQTGVGTGTCTGSAGLLSMTQYFKATGSDFAGASLNGAAAQLAGLQACTNQMMSATQDRLKQMPELLTSLQACTTEACATAQSGRIQYEIAMINTQQNQTMLLGLTAQNNRWTQQDQRIQLMRANEEALMTSTGNGPFVSSPGTSDPIVNNTPIGFNAPMFGQGQ